MNSSDENDDLWRLLGKTRPPAVSHFFSRDVLREVRGLRQEPSGILATLRRHWQWTLATVATACGIAVLATQFAGGESRSGQPDALAEVVQQVSDSPDYFVINDLDDLLASEESSVWLDNSVH